MQILLPNFSKGFDFLVEKNSLMRKHFLKNIKSINDMNINRYKCREHLREDKINHKICGRAICDSQICMTKYEILKTY